jgi:hypothetical protein
MGVAVSLLPPTGLGGNKKTKWAESVPMGEPVWPPKGLKNHEKSFEVPKISSGL